VETDPKRRGLGGAHVRMDIGRFVVLERQQVLQLEMAGTTFLGQ